MAKRRQTRSRKLNVEFAYKLHSKQQEIYDLVMGNIVNAYGDPFRFILAIFGRQTGKSMLGKIILLLMAINFGKRCLWVSPTIGTARKHWIDMKTMLIEAGITVESGYVTSINESAKEIVFYNGGIINIRSAIEPDNLRGLTIDFMVLDEAAFFRDGEYVWNSVLFPMLTVSRGKALFLTSPFGRNWVYNLFRKGQDIKDKFFASRHATVYDNPHQDFELLEYQKENMPSLQWRAEFMAEFLADHGGVFSGVEEAAVLPLMSRPDPHRRYIMGFDFTGGAGDANACSIIDITETPARQVYGLRWFETAPSRVARKILELVDLWQPEHVYWEKNGVGEVYTRLLREMIKYGDDVVFEDVELDQYDVEEYTASPQGDQPLSDLTFKYNRNVKLHALSLQNNSKRMLVENCAAAIEYGRLQILNDDSQYGDIQISEMSTYERQLTAKGLGVTYNGASGSHDDTVSALYLACRGLAKTHASKRAAAAKQTAKNARRNPFRSTQHSFRKVRNNASSHSVRTGNGKRTR